MVNKEVSINLSGKYFLSACETMISGLKSSDSHSFLMIGIPTMTLTDMYLPKAKERSIGFDVMVSIKGVFYLVIAERTP